MIYVPPGFSFVAAWNEVCVRWPDDESLFPNSLVACECDAFSTCRLRWVINEATAPAVGGMVEIRFMFDVMNPLTSARPEVNFWKLSHSRGRREDDRVSAEILEENP